MADQSYSAVKNETLTEVLAPTLAALESPKIENITYPGDDTAASTDGGQTVTITGSGFKTGATVTIDSVTVGVSSVVDANTITIVTPAKSTGSYSVYVLNTDGGTAFYLPGIQYSGTPTWSTSAGSLGSVYETQSIDYTVSASSDSTITYSIASGTLVDGGSLNSSTGQITGTAQSVEGSTTYTFGIDATDEELQDTRRTFTITVEPDVVTWSTPANGSSYSNTVGDVFSVSLSASSAVGGNITYTANALPSGLSIGTSNIFGTFSTAGNSSSLITATASGTNKTATQTLNWDVVAAPAEVAYGWFGGGDGAAAMDRITFANDMFQADPRIYNTYPILSQYGATGNQSYGWFGGGQPGENSFVARLDYSNDSSLVTVGSLNYSSNFPAATGNDSYGWFAGGIKYPSIYATVSRITYANDGVTATTRGSLTVARHSASATGNSNYGWFAGGMNYPSWYSTVDRIDYSNDGVSAIGRGPLSGSRYSTAATGNSNFGYIGGGNYPSPVATVNKIDYASDSATAVTKGPLSLARQCLAATGSSNYGWFGGGNSSSSPSLSTVDRIDYANDTPTASVRGTLAFARTCLGAVGGYPG